MHDAYEALATQILNSCGVRVVRNNVIEFLAQCIQSGTPDSVIITGLLTWGLDNLTTLQIVGLVRELRGQR